MPARSGCRNQPGFGDRLGLSTPGHVRAVRKTDMAPIFAQQSVRENERTGRSPQEVLDDAMWGVFQEGWSDRFGADADHLKTAEHVSAFAAAGYSFFTIDPGEYVDNAASLAPAIILDQKLQALPWDGLETTFSDVQRTLAQKPIDLGTLKVTFNREEIMRAGNLVHLKTAGTSYLEALRTIGSCNPRLFREIHSFAVDRYPTDRASYHVSAEISRMADPAALDDEERIIP